MKSWLTIASRLGRRHYQNTKNSDISLIYRGSRPITPRFPTRPGRILKENAWPAIPVQKHHAPQGPEGPPKVKTVQQAGAGNHRRGKAGPARPGNECAAALRDHPRPPGEHVEGL